MNRFALFRRVRPILRSHQGSPLLLGCLWLCSQLFRGGVWIRHRLYDLSWLSSRRLQKCCVVSVGNLVVGGTGKTPLVHLLAETFAASRRVGIVTRGYGGWQGIGDEAALLARRLPHVKIYSGKQRVSLATQAEQEGCQLLVMDDGFQHRALARDIDCLLLHTEDLQAGKQYYLPRGFLRDELDRVSRADFLFLYPIISVEEGVVWQKRFPGAIGLKLGVQKIAGVSGQELLFLRGRRLGLFAGIARPSYFQAEVERLGGEIVSTIALEDHEPIGEVRLRAWAFECQRLGAEALVCTEKDWVKIPTTIAVPLPIFYLEMSLEIVFGLHVWEKLVDQIEKKLDTV